MTDDLDWGAWDAPITQEVRLPSSGRPAVLHSTLRMGEICRRGLWTDAILDYLRVQVGEEETIDPERAVAARDRIMVAAFVRPRLVLTEDEAGPGDVPVSRLTDDEVDDVMTFVLGGRDFLDAFRGRAADAADGGGENGGAAEPAAPGVAA